MNTILDLFADRIKNNPDSIALQYKDRFLSYAELDNESDKIAHFLKSQGIQSGSRVALYLERSEKVVIHILGVLKTGAAYIFLDPGYPSDRLNYMLNFSEPDLLIAGQGNTQWKQNVNTRLIECDEIVFTEDKFVQNTVSASDLAYLMFTSGSTGKPKAVMINHGNLLAYLPSINALKKVNKKDTCLHTASFSFSSSVRQLFVPLINNAKLIIAPEEDKSNLLSLLRVIKNEGVTVVDTIQSLWRYGIPVIESMKPDEYAEIIDNNLRLIVFSGDILPKFLISRIKNHSKQKNVEIINLYGQTETIGGIAFPIPPDYSEDKGYVPIGYPLQHLNVFILKENLKPVEQGEAGEIFVSGTSVGDGYFRDPEMTQKSFLGKLDFEGAPERIFRTGDIGKRSEAGYIEIIGRLDFQVKIRGIRIELAEIETVLVSHPEIKDAIITAHEKNEGEKYLVAYYILAKSSKLSTFEIRDYLRQRLPDSMVPSWFMKLDKFILTPNGKIDRKALPIPQNNLQESSFDIDILTNTQKNLALIYTNLLGIDSINIEDSFFDIGGHSLLAVQLTEMIERIFGKKLPVNQVYQTPSVAKLAIKVDSMGAVDVFNPLVNLQPFGSKLPFFIVHGDDCSFLLPKYLGEEIPFYGFFHQGQDGSHMQFKTIDTIAQAYVNEIEKLKLQTPIVLGGYSIGGVIAFEMACRLQKKGYSIAKLILLDPLAPRTQAQVLWGEHSYDTNTGTFSKVNNSNIPQESINKLKPSLSLRVYNRFSLLKNLLICQYCLLTKRLIPPNLRNYYIMGTYRKARKIYKGNIFTGDAILFRSTIHNFDLYDLGWNEFIKGNLEIFEIKGDHHTTIREPAIAQVGKIIKDLIFSLDR
jgi:amino acid adenylation domain-containing protein